MIVRMSTDEPKIAPLSDDEQAWLTERLTAARQAGLLADPQALADSFDTSRDDFHTKSAHERGDASVLVNIYSVAFGEHFSRAYGLQWCIVSASFAGSASSTGQDEIGLLHPESGMVLLPLATVAARWQDPGMRPMADLIAQTQQALEGLKAEPEE